MIEWAACTGLSEQDLHPAPQIRSGLRQQGCAFDLWAFQSRVV